MWYSNSITASTTDTTTNTVWDWTPNRTWTTSTTSTSNWDKYKRAEFLQDWIKRTQKREKIVESEIKEDEILNLLKGDI